MALVRPLRSPFLATWNQSSADDEDTRHEKVLGKVSVVDDDESIRESLPDLLRQFGFSVEAFPSAEDFLASDVLEKTQCLILDVAMPGMSGPELQQELRIR